MTHSSLLHTLYFSLFFNSTHKHLNITDTTRQGNTPRPSCYSPFEPQNVSLELSLLCTLYFRPHRNSAPVSARCSTQHCRKVAFSRSYCTSDLHPSNIFTFTTSVFSDSIYIANSSQRDGVGNAMS